MKQDNQISRIVAAFCVLMLMFILSFQIFHLIEGYGWTWVRRAYKMRNLSAMERNALGLFGKRGANYMKFIDTTVPTNGTVVVPENGGSFSQQSILQFFLMPRGIPTCGCSRGEVEYDDQCLKCLRAPNHYIPALGDFPRAELLEGWKEFIPLDQNNDFYHGIYVPLGVSNNSNNGEADFTQEKSLTSAIIIDGLIILLLFALGTMVVRIIHSDLSWIDVSIIGIPIGAGLLSWLVFLQSWLGIPITRITFLVNFIVLIFLLFIVSYFIRGNIWVVPEKKIQLRLFFKSLIQRPFLTSTWLAFLSLFLLAAAISIVRGYSLFDGIANWALKGYGIAQEGTIYAGLKWGVHSIEYPQNIHILISLFRLMDGDILPGSKLLFPIFTLSMMLGCYRFWSRNYVIEELAALGILVLFSTPKVFLFSTIGWGNMIFTTYLVLGTFYLCDGFFFHRDNKDAFLGGLLLGLAAWTRPEGVGFIFALAIGLLCIRIFSKCKSASNTWALPMIIIPGIWLFFGLKSMRKAEIGGVAGAFFQKIAEGKMTFDSLSILLPFSKSSLQNQDIWGFLCPIIITLFILGLMTNLRQFDTYVLGICISALILFFLPHLMFFMASFSKPGYEVFLCSSYDRALFPGLILGFCGALLLSARRRRCTPFFRHIDHLESS
jgi:hypothetical protein